MASVARMARKKKEHGVSARTAPSVASEVALAVLSHRRDGVKAGGRALHIEALVGAVLLDFLRRPHEEQRAILDRRIPEHEALIEHELGGAPAPEPREAAPMEPYDPAKNHPKRPGRGHKSS